MKIPNETKVGILAIIALFILGAGYYYLKGKDLFSSNYTIFAEYKKIDGLVPSSEIMINGLRVGSVSKVYLKEDHSGRIMVEMDIKGEVKVPTTTIARIETPGLMGSPTVLLEFDEGETSFVNDGDLIQGANSNFIGTMLKGATPTFNTLGQKIDSIIKEKFPEGEGIDFKTMGANMESTLESLKSATKNLDKLVAQSSGKFSKILSNVEAITQNIKDNNAQINNILSNTSQFSNDLKKVKLSETAGKADEAIVELKQTLDEANKAVANLDKILVSLEKGEGSMGKLLKDEALYNDLDKTLVNLDKLLQDMRLNPKRYVHLSVFGRKQKAYKATDDPAEEEKGN